MNIFTNIHTFINTYIQTAELLVSHAVALMTEQTFHDAKTRGGAV